MCCDLCDHYYTCEEVEKMKKSCCTKCDEHEDCYGEAKSVARRTGTDGDEETNDEIGEVIDQTDEESEDEEEEDDDGDEEEEDDEDLDDEEEYPARRRSNRSGR